MKCYTEKIHNIQICIAIGKQWWDLLIFCMKIRKLHILSDSDLQGLSADFAHYLLPWTSFPDLSGNLPFFSVSYSGKLLRNNESCANCLYSPHIPRNTARCPHSAGPAPETKNIVRLSTEICWSKFRQKSAEFSARNSRICLVFLLFDKRTMWNERKIQIFSPILTQISNKSAKIRGMPNENESTEFDCGNRMRRFRYIKKINSPRSETARNLRKT